MLTKEQHTQIYEALMQNVDKLKRAWRKADKDYDLLGYEHSGSVEATLRAALAAQAAGVYVAARDNAVEYFNTYIND